MIFFGQFSILVHKYSLKFMNHGISSIQGPAAVNEKRLINKRLFDYVHYAYGQIKSNFATKQKFVAADTNTQA